MRTIHFCAESFDRRDGGLAESAQRILAGLALQPDMRLIAYPMEVACSGPSIEGAARTVNVAFDASERPLWGKLDDRRRVA